MSINNPRIRTVKPDLHKNEVLAAIEQELKIRHLRLFFIALFHIADAEGRFPFRPRQIKLHCLPYDDIDVAQYLLVLANYGYLIMYVYRDPVSGTEEEYLQIVGWHQHQSINAKEPESEIPSPCDPSCRIIAGVAPERPKSMRRESLRERIAQGALPTDAASPEPSPEPPDTQVAPPSDKVGQGLERASQPDLFGTPAPSEASMNQGVQSTLDAGVSGSSAPLVPAAHSKATAQSGGHHSRTAQQQPKFWPDAYREAGRSHYVYPEAFERFWQAYPSSRRVGKPKTFKSFQTEVAPEDLETVIADLERRPYEDWKWVKDGGKYIPIATTYLNQRRWEDPYEHPPSQHQQGASEAPPVGREEFVQAMAQKEGHSRLASSHQGARHRVQPRIGSNV